MKVEEGEEKEGAKGGLKSYAKLARTDASISSSGKVYVPANGIQPHAPMRRAGRWGVNPLLPAHLS